MVDDESVRKRKMEGCVKLFCTRAHVTGRPPEDGKRRQTGMCLTTSRSIKFSRQEEGAQGTVGYAESKAEIPRSKYLKSVIFQCCSGLLREDEFVGLKHQPEPQTCPLLPG